MIVTIKFRGGLFDSERADVHTLDAIKIFIDETGRQAYAYINQNDGVYLYSPAQTERLMQDFDHTVKFWGNSDFHVKSIVPQATI